MNNIKNIPKKQYINVSAEKPADVHQCFCQYRGATHKFRTTPDAPHTISSVTHQYSVPVSGLQYLTKRHFALIFSYFKGSFLFTTSVKVLSLKLKLYFIVLLKSRSNKLSDLNLENDGRYSPNSNIGYNKGC